MGTYNGNHKSQTIRASAKDDMIFARAGDDTVFALAGNDRVWGGYGNDVIYGGDGDDGLIGDEGNNFNTGNDQLYGEGGNDSLSGEGGTDFLDGGSGNDSLAGGDGDDTLIGGAGNDSLRGGRGNDVLTGGEGADRFWYVDFANLRETGGFDIIMDYAPGEGDTLDLSWFDSNSELEGTQTWAWGTNDTPWSGSSEPGRLVLGTNPNGDNVLSFFINDGDLLPDLTITLVGVAGPVTGIIGVA